MSCPRLLEDLGDDARGDRLPALADGESESLVHCDRVDDAPIAPLNTLEDNLYGSTVYTIMGHRLEFIGLCPQCSMDEQARLRAEQMFGLITEQPQPSS